LFASLKEGWAHALGLPSGRFCSRRSFGAAEEAAVRQVFRHYAKEGKDFGYQGRFEEKYCRAWVDYLGTRGFADGVATGTAAVYVGLAALRLPAGSEVGVSPITDPGTVNAIILNGLSPVLVDSMAGSYNIGPDQLSRAISRKMRAVIVVHCHGRAAPISDLVALARTRRVQVMEDCSQAHGATWKGRQVGTFGDLAAFSTMYRKNHASGGCGGLVFTRRRLLYEQIRAAADRGKPFFRRGFDEKNPAQFLFPALNLNMDEISAAVGLANLGKLDSVNDRRRQLVFRLQKNLRQNSRRFYLDSWTDADAPFFVPVHLREGSAGAAEAAGHWLARQGVPVNAKYRYLVSEWPYLRRYLRGNRRTPNARATRNGSFNLLLHERWSLADIDFISERLIEYESKLLR
jgi:dTDP-4-amino-4,6-dideoxygalactose transaminase